MKFNEYPRWWVLVLVLGFLASGRYWMDQQDQRVKDQISGLQQENEMLVRRNEHLSYINGLAGEFSMDPTIVTLVDRYSREYMRKSGPEWRLVRTPEFMSYIMLSLIYCSFAFCGTGGRVCPTFSSYRFITYSVSFLTPAGFWRTPDFIAPTILSAPEPLACG